MKTKTYVVTGSTSGIGKALLERIAADNVVFAGYRDKSKLEILQALSPNIYPFYVDYAKPESIKYAAEYLISKCTKIDTLVNIAGCVVAGPVEKIDISEIRRQFDVNVFGHLELTKDLIDLLEGGKIINVSSMVFFRLYRHTVPPNAVWICFLMHCL